MRFKHVFSYNSYDGQVTGEVIDTPWFFDEL